ncbi:OmpH family outer membrane protein [Pelagibacterales bacterium SAG-MED10]|nr:OmpH family outer membrane protein [Pelagibacterales bacterium SAG-MED10]
MYKFYKLIFFCLFIFYQSNVYSSERKIVYLNLDEIIQKSIPGKLILQKLHEQNKMNLEKFKSKRSNLINQEKDIIKKKNILSKEEFEANVSDLNKKMKNFNKEREQTFLKFEEEKKKKLNNFLSKITPLIETFVKENSINIVLNKKNLFIASKNFDITNQIIEIVNKNIK